VPGHDIRTSGYGPLGASDPAARAPAGPVDRVDHPHGWRPAPAGSVSTGSPSRYGRKRSARVGTRRSGGPLTRSRTRRPLGRAPRAG